jgi:hypothetical protein
MLVERGSAVILGVYGERSHADHIGNLKRASERIQKEASTDAPTLHLGMNGKSREHEQRDRVARHSLRDARWRVSMENLAGNDRMVADDITVSHRDVGLRRVCLLRLQRVSNEKAIELGLPASEPFDGVRAT